MPKQGCKRISYDERIIIEEMLNKGCSITYIAEVLNRPHQTIYHELKRCKSHSKYCANYAQQDYLKKNEKNGRKPKLLLDKSIAQYISKLILEESLSPEEVINRLHLDNFSNAPLSKTTIYSAIDDGLIPSVTRKTLISKRKKSRLLSNRCVKIPKEICDKLDIKEYDNLEISVSKNKIIIEKSNHK